MHSKTTEVLMAAAADAVGRGVTDLSHPSRSMDWTLCSSRSSLPLLADTDQAAKANLGMANVHRWNGLPGAAEPLYQRVLAAEPANKDAAEGLTYAQRETKPASSIPHHGNVAALGLVGLMYSSLTRPYLQ